MCIPRNAIKNLRDWAALPNRKPLLVRGARQVGKTTLVRQFANEFDNYIELNLEREAERKIFETDDVKKILNAALFLKNKGKGNGKMLLFIDEIQESANALQTLRFFYEDLPEIYVIAAGSLLEFTLNKVASFPVGRVMYLYLSPLSFEEFLLAFNYTQAFELLNIFPIPDYAHSKILDLFHEYVAIGGMPEIVSNYASTKKVSSLNSQYKQLWQAYKDDVEKYASSETDRKIIRHIIETAPFETDRIKFEGFGRSNYRSREVGECIRALDLAGIIRLMYPTTNTQPPIVADIRKRPRLQFLDTGLLNHLNQQQAQLLLTNDLNSFQQGKVIQHVVYQELITIENLERYNPHFWVREEKDSNAEVDLVYQYNNFLIPIEVKAGKQGTLRSLHQFVERTNHPYAIRLYAGNFVIEKAKTPAGTNYLLMNLPYYLASKIPQYIGYFVSNYNLNSL